MQLNEMIDHILFKMPLELRWKARIARRFASSLLGAGVPVLRLSGLVRSSGRRATLLIAGHEPWIDHLPRRFFAEPPRRELIRRATIWELPRLLAQMRTSADLTIARVDRISLRLFFQQDYLRAPEWIGASIELNDEVLAPAFRKKNVSNDLRKIRRHGLSWSVSHAESDFEFFHKTMYAPYAQNRFGDMAGVMPASYLRHEFRQGGLLFVEQDGTKIAASLFRVLGDSYYFLKLGARDGQRHPVEIGALAALYVFGIGHARSLGCKHLDLGGSRSLLQDGVLRFKLKWGARIGESGSQVFQYLIYWNRLSGAAADFFFHNSLIFYDSGGFSAIHTPENDGAPPSPRSFEGLRIRGLHRLYLANRNEMASDSIVPSGVTLLPAATKPGQFESFKGFTGS